jgi:hypothetical protein
MHSDSSCIRSDRRHHDDDNRRHQDALAARYGSPPALRHDWRQFAYTDGSVLQGKGGGDDPVSCPGIGARCSSTIYTCTCPSQY